MAWKSNSPYDPYSARVIRPLPSPPWKYCARCGEKILQGHRYCTSCGEQVGMQEKLQPLYPSNCGGCGGTLQKKFDFCPHCGNQVKKGVPATPACSCGVILITNARHCVGCGKVVEKLDSRSGQ